MKYAFLIVDVFSSTPFGGNQLAVLPDAVGISTEGMRLAGAGRLHASVDKTVRGFLYLTNCNTSEGMASR